MAKIVQISDTHLFAGPGGRLKGVDVDASLQAVVAHVGDHHGDAELVLVTGDLVHEETAASYARLARRLAGLALPVYCLPGNHEDKALLARACEGTVLRCDKRIEVGGWQVLMLDSGHPPEPVGYLAEDELAFLDRRLGEQPRTPALVALHHPPLTVSSPWMDAMGVANGGDLLAVIDRHPQVRAVVFGHIHQRFETSRAGVRYLGVPSTCVQFAPGTAAATVDTRAPGYRWLTLAGGGLDTGVERVAGASTPGPGAG